MIAPITTMTNARLHQLLQKETQIVEGEPGFWHIEFAGRTLLVLTDETHNRLRIMTPVIEDEELETDDYRILLSANFDRALDARYALANDVLWSVFLHPLRELSETLLMDALQQVVRLAENFGDTYASSDLMFEGG